MYGVNEQETFNFSNKEEVMANQQSKPETSLAVTDLEKKYPATQYNRLLPSTLIGSISPLQKLSIEVLQIDPEPNNGEVFEVGNVKGKDGEWEKRYSPTKTALDRIAHTVGISWIPEQTRRIDDRSNPKLTEFKAVGILKKSDGTVQILTGTKEIDLDAMEIELTFKLEESARQGKLKEGNEVLKFGTQKCNEYIQRRVTKRMIELRKFKVPIAESGAKNRAIRSLGLKSSYSEADLKKPFVVPRIDFNPEVALADPELRREIIRESMAAGVQLFGPSPTPLSQIPSSNGGKQQIQDAEFQEEKSESVEEKSASKESQISKEDERRMELEGLTTQQRVDIAKELATKKGKRIEQKAFEEKPIEAQVKNIQWLEEQPDKKPLDDLPF